MNPQTKWIILTLASILFAIDQTTIAADPTELQSGNTIKFTDVRTQTLEFINYYKTIKLTPQQEKIKTEALSSIPAPCCSDYSIATCCCPCNFAKSTWGLAHYLIARKNYDVPRLKQAVAEWVKFTHSNGYNGNSCYEGRCNRPFHEDGCGGMKDEVSF